MPRLRDPYSEGFYASLPPSLYAARAETPASPATVSPAPRTGGRRRPVASVEPEPQPEPEPEPAEPDEAS